MPSPSFQTLLHHSHRYHPLYGDRLANHLSMALLALERMGASSAQMETFASAYAKRLRLRAEVEPVDAFERALHYIHGEMRAYGAMDVVRAWLPALLPGVAASAFHCLIRLAYAVEAQDEDELAQALAYWVTSFEVLGPLGRVVKRTPEQIADEAARGVADVVFAPGIIIDRMQQISAAMAQRNLVMQPRTLSLDGVARFALHAYAQQEDFTLLHTVTGAHALRVLAPLVDDMDAALRWLWQGVLAAYLTVERDAGAAPVAAPALSWDECRQRACASLDDHVVKLTYTAWRESQYRAGEPLYLAVAARKVWLDTWH